MEEKIKFICPSCGTILTTANVPGIEDKSFTCPVCKKKARIRDCREKPESDKTLLSDRDDAVDDYRHRELSYLSRTSLPSQIRSFAPKFTELNDKVIFNDVWNRNERISLRDRCIVTISSLISQGKTDDSLAPYIRLAMWNDVTCPEIEEIITHIGFYAGWAKACEALKVAKKVFDEDVITQ